MDSGLDREGNEMAAEGRCPGGDQGRTGGGVGAQAGQGETQARGPLLGAGATARGGQLQRRLATVGALLVQAEASAAGAELLAQLRGATMGSGSAEQAMVRLAGAGRMLPDPLNA